MIKGIFSTLAGKFANEKRLDIISNNLANAATAGYKASRPVFNVVTVENESAEPNKPQSTYVNIYDSYIHFSDAPLVETGGSFDLAMEGEGFFAVNTPEGTRYTRNGQFTLNNEKRLVTMDGNPVLGQGGEITIDGKQVSIEKDGSIFVDKSFVDVIRVVDFSKRSDLRSAGRSLFINTNAGNEETTPQNYSVRQGFYEASNVNVVREMVDMISSVRAYETYTKVDQMFDDMLAKLNDMGR
jgi:flagellar basal-body rod protein FlgF